MFCVFLRIASNWDSFSKQPRWVFEPFFEHLKENFFSHLEMTWINQLFLHLTILAIGNNNKYVAQIDIHCSYQFVQGHFIF